MPRLGKTYDIDIQVVSKPKADYLTDEYFELDLPVAPAVMVGEAIVTEGADVAAEKIESEICCQLGVDPPKPKGFMARLLGR